MRLHCLALTASVLSLVISFPLFGQGPASLRPKVFAIRDAKVVTAPGQVLPKSNIVIRDGLIADVGPDIEIPADALKIDAKGMTVYPGFIDACSHWGFDPAQRRTLGGPPATEDFASEALVATK